MTDRGRCFQIRVPCRSASEPSHQRRRKPNRVWQNLTAQVTALGVRRFALTPSRFGAYPGCLGPKLAGHSDRWSAAPGGDLTAQRRSEVEVLQHSRVMLPADMMALAMTRRPCWRIGLFQRRSPVCPSAFLLHSSRAWLGVHSVVLLGVRERVLLEKDPLKHRVRT
jgi:hypothetical protein